MATYLQGITDYIPDVQPFQPDFNILGQALQTKEAQYQKGYDTISGIYGTLLNSQLTHNDNIERRDHYFTQIQNQIQKISGLDLSSPDNITAAKQVFKPLIDDKYLHRDMVFTKSMTDARRASENYKNCVGENCDGDWWEEGDAAIAYQAEEFANASLEDTLGMGNLDYVPFYNAYEMAMDYAKEMGFAPEFISYSKDGKYRIKTTGGMEMIPALWENMQAVLGQKQELRSMYNTEAYVTRKNYIKQNAQEFGGEEQAERQYFTEIFSEVEKANGQTQANLEKQNKQIQLSKQLVKDSTKTPSYPGYDKDPDALLLELDEQKQIIDANKKDADLVADLSNPSVVPNLSVSQLRNRVDNIYAMNMMTQTFQHAAGTYAELTKKVDVKADEYELLRVNHQYRLAEMRAKASMDAAAELSLAEQMGITEAFVTPGGAQQNDVDYDVKEENEKSQRELKYNLAGSTQKGVGQILAQLNNIITDPNKSAAEKATAQKLIEENFGNLIVNKQIVTATDRNFKVRNNTLYSVLDYANEQLENFFTGNPGTEKIEKKEVVSEGVVTKERDGTYSVSDWQSLPEIVTNEQSEFNAINVSNKLKDLINTEEFRLLIKGGESYVMPDLEATLNQMNASKALLKGYQNNELDNNKKVIQHLKLSKDGKGYSSNKVLNDALDIYLDDNGQVRNLEEFRKHISPILAKHPNEYIPRLGMVGATVVPKFSIGQGMTKEIYEKITEDYMDLYNVTDVPALATEFTPMGGHTGIYSEGIGYMVDSLFGAAPNNIAAYETLLALTQQGIFSNPDQQGAVWVPGDAATISQEDIEGVSEEDKSKAQAIGQQFSMDFLTANPKDKKDNRPRGQIISYGIALGDSDKVAITFKLSQAHVKSLQGSEKRPGVHNAFFGEDPTQATFSVILPREKLTSYKDGNGTSRPVTMMERHTLTPEEKIFNLQGGNYSIDYGFNERDRGSKVVFKRQNGSITSQIEYYNYNEDQNIWQKQRAPILHEVNSTFKTAVEVANANARAIYQNNLNTINQLRQ
jgi:hypothetical protein